MTAARKPVKALNKDAATVAANAAAEKARKAASRKALRDAKKATTTRDPVEGEPAFVAPAAPAPATRATMKASDSAAYEAAIRADAASLGLDDAAIEIYVAEHLDTTEKKRKYEGPMLALVAARKSYVKGSNGNPHNGDLIGQAFQSLPRSEVVDLCIALLGLPGNPYLALNPGQQSMNLRNKLRHAIRNGFVSEASLIAYTTKATA